MTDQKAEGTAKDLGGKVKEGVGNATDNDKMRREGQTDQSEGKLRKAAGNVKDAIKGR